MKNKKDKIYVELEIKYKEGLSILKEIDDYDSFKKNYLKWFLPVQNAIKIIQPEIYNTFVECYNTKSGKFTFFNFRIHPYLKNMIPNSIGYDKPYEERFKQATQKVKNLLQYQLDLIYSIIENKDSLLLNFDNELFFSFQEENVQVAQNLLDNDFIRAAGAICGVIIEKHLIKLLIPFDEKAYSYTLGKLNIECKRYSLYSETEKKRIDLYINYRNLCDHKNKINPTKNQVQDLIDGTKWILVNI